MSQLSPTERTTRYATTVPDLPSAWAFIMAHLDSVGDAPTIHITPRWTLADADADWSGPTFEAVVEGMIKVQP